MDDETETLRRRVAELAQHERAEAAERALRGTPDERVEAMRKRARALIERDPVQALANVATALAMDEVRDAEQRAQRAEAEAARLREAAVEALARLDREGLRASAAKLRAALDAQPPAVPATCGVCEYAWGIPGATGCSHPGRTVERVDADQPPPEACPLRGGR